MAEPTFEQVYKAKEPSFEDVYGQARGEAPPKEGGFRGAMNKVLDTVPPLHKQPAANAAATMAAMPPGLGALGRIATSAGIGGARSLVEHGMSDAGLTTLLDAAVAGVSEGMLGGAGKLASKLGKSVRGFDYATSAPGKALDLLRDRVLGGKFVIPSFGADKITIDEAVKKLASMTGPAYRVARDEIAAVLKRIDTNKMQGLPGKSAGRIFLDETSKKRFGAPSTFAEVANAAGKALKSPVTRGAADVAVTSPMDDERSGIPIGLPMLERVAEHVRSIPGLLSHVAH